MNNERETAVHFYEMLTGVFNDKESKSIRFLCFGALIFGVMLAGYSYFRVSLFADTERALEEEYHQPPESTSSIQALAKMAGMLDRFRNIGAMRAETIEDAHNMPFNLESQTGTGIAELAQLGGATVNVPEAEPVQGVSTLNVKMIMTDDEGRKLAVVDAGGEKALILRRGDRLPGGGFVSSIKPDEITVIIDKQERKFEVPALPSLSYRTPEGQQKFY
ncbi:MAG: hypothetical protein IJR98_03055 [Synergistaceae bacterium]|nr:hypothetical protein [Synergistaceae bacterium]